MNTILLASSAKLGGALQSRTFAHRAPVESVFCVRPKKSGGGLRRLALIGLWSLSTTPIFAAPAVTLAWNPNPETDISSYKLSYGTTSGVYPTVVDTGSNTQVTVADLAEGTTYYFVVSATNTAGVQSPYSSEISYYAEPAVVPPSGVWSLHYVDSQESQTYQGAAAFDGDPSTFWHTAWSGSPTPPPHEIQINLGASQSINGFRYLPRQDAKLVGNVGQFEFYVSADGVNWGNPVATGAFPNTREQKEIRFAQTSARYIRLRGLSDGNGGIYMTVAELGVIQDSQPPVTNQAPLALSKSLSTGEDTAGNIALQGSDADGDTLTFAVVTAPTKGSLSGTAPNLTYTPSANYNGVDSFTYLASDGTVNSATATVSITVTPVNDAPLATSKSVATAEDTSLPIVLAGTDPDLDSLTFSVVTAPAHGTLTGTAPNLVYSPTANFAGADQFTFRVNDGTVNSTTATISITVTAVNDAPVATASSVATTEDTSLPITLAGTDPDGNSLTYSVVAAPANGTLTGTVPNLTYSPAANFTGTDQFTFRVNDGTVNSATATVSITVGALNDAPVAISRSVSVAENGSLPITLTGTDVEGNPLFFTVLGGPANGLLSGTAPNLTYYPGVGFNGSDAISFRVSDGLANSASATISITVTPVNDAPSAISKSVSTAEDNSLPITLAGTDPDGNPLTFTLVGSPVNGILIGTAPNLTYRPAANFNGSDAFSFRVSDGTAESLPGTVSITVTPVNDAPLAVSKSVTTVTGSALPITLTGTDPDSNNLTFAVVAAPAHGTLAGTAPNLTYSPGANHTGTDQFTFQVNDGTVNSATATVSIIVTSTNTPPVFIADLIAFTATEDQAFTGQLLAFDADSSDALTFQKVSGPAWLTVSADGKIDGTPLDADVGTSSFIVKASDRSNASATATLNITVANANGAPVFAIKPLVYPAGTEKEPYLQSLANTATDSDSGDTITYSKVDGPAWLVIGKSGALSGTPPDGSVGINLFTIRATDAAGASDDTTLQIKININDLPLPWYQDRVGTSNLAGAGKLSSGIFTVAGAGLLADRQDSGNFVWQTLTGDGNITARVSKLHNTGTAARVGVVIRESLAANSRQIFMGVNGASNYHWLRRSSTGGSTSKTTKTGSTTASIWVRLVRSGNTVTAYRSTNGTSWTKMGSSNVTMSKNCYIGLWVSSGSDTLLNTSLFDKVVVTP